MEQKLTDQELARRDKLNKLIEMGVNPWGEAYKRTDTSATCREKAKDKTNEDLEANPIEVNVAGRLLLLTFKISSERSKSIFQ